MATIQFTKKIPAITVVEGANLMDTLLNAGLPVASSCHGDGICGKCRVRVVKGAENLSKKEGLEVILHDRLKIPVGFRISCQTQVFGDIEIDTTYW